VDASPRFARWPWWRRWFGQRSERFAARFLRRLGYRILALNLSDRAGEIDLLALDGKSLVIVEVRSSESKDFQSLAESVNTDKQRRLTEAALRFFQRSRLLNEVPMRFDVLLLRWPPGAGEPETRHYRHAFEATGRFQMYS
jgi:putative endonuclease